jgi:hypothetical protein
MRSDHKDKGNNAVGVELKYCEHCGGLWVRERGAGVYCNKCSPKVADLPKPPKRWRKPPTLPVRPHTVVDDFEFEIDVEEISDFEAARGVA